MRQYRCANVPCTRHRKDWQLCCPPCWNSLPRDFRTEYFMTKPRSTERLEMVMRALRDLKAMREQKELVL